MKPDAHDEPILLMTARTAFESKVVVGVLSGAGIEAFSSTGNLMDEFSMAQLAMNLQGVDVFVKSECADEAQRVLDAARSAGKFIDEQAE